MKLYSVNVVITASADILVAANDEQEAKDFAEHMGLEEIEGCTNLDLNDIEGAEAEEVKRSKENGRYICDPDDAVNYVELTEDEQNELESEVDENG